jgi:uridine phosphorylase
MDSPIPGTGFYLEGDPHVDPAKLVAHLCASRGITTADLGVRAVVVATFNETLTRYLAESSAATRAEHSLRQHDPTFVTPEGVSIMTFGIGAPVAVAMAEEAYTCGMRTLIVAGSAGSLSPHATLGTIVVPVSALREEGTSHHYAPHDVPAEADPGVIDTVKSVLAERGTPYLQGVNWTTDAIYREHKAKIAMYRAAGVLTVDMELSALYTLGACRGIATGAVLAVSDELHGESWEIGFGSEDVTRGMARAGHIALEAATRIAKRAQEA